jgi:hypothetical protein
MPSVEDRLKKLEERTRGDVERWQVLEGEIKAFSAIISCMLAPIAAQTPAIARIIVQNLRTYEDVARMQNEHAQMMQRLRVVREILEAKLEKGGSSGAKNASPRRRK